MHHKYAMDGTLMHAQGIGDVTGITEMRSPPESAQAVG
jgi:hypothetical protein